MCHLITVVAITGGAVSPWEFSPFSSLALLRKVWTSLQLILIITIYFRRKQMFVDHGDYNSNIIVFKNVGWCSVWPSNVDLCHILSVGGSCFERLWSMEHRGNLYIHTCKGTWEFPHEPVCDASYSFISGVACFFQGCSNPWIISSALE